MLWRHPSIDFFREGFKEGRGCLALEAIKAGTLILHAPLECCLVPSSIDSTVELAMIHRIKKALEDEGDALHEYLRGLRGRDEFKSHPVTWTDFRMEEELGGTLLIDVYKATVGNWFTNGILPDDETTRFATAVMLSRCFEHELVGLALVPFADQFNHSSNNWHTRIREDGANGFCMYAERDIAAGDQIFNFYGPYSNPWLLLTHGFTEDQNPFNDLLLPDDNTVKSVCVTDLVFPTDLNKEELRSRLAQLKLASPLNTLIRDLEIVTLEQLLTLPD